MADAFANFGDTKMRVSIGSAGVDYSDPMKPVYKGAVGYGGRRRANLVGPSILDARRGKWLLTLV